MSWLKEVAGSAIKSRLPRSTRRRIIRLLQWPPVGWVRFGSLRRLHPIGEDWGSLRGLPIDRYYIEGFLRQHADDIRGRVLEVKDRSYTLQFGDNRVTESDVLHKEPGNPEATIIADLAVSPPLLPAETFDAIICTQTLQFIFDVHAATRTLYHSLKPGGTLLLTVPAMSQISRYDMERWGDYWRFTSLALRRLLEESCPKAQIDVEAMGNVLTAIASLHGIASNELRQNELATVDPEYELIVTARVRKPG